MEQKFLSSKKISEYFIPVKKHLSKDITVPSHQLMLKAGLIKQVSSGLYAWLPLGMRVLNKVNEIIRQEMDKINALEVIVPTMQPQELWEQSGRKQYCGDETLSCKDRHGKTLIYGPTAEEVMTFIATNEVQSYKHLPLTMYNIQWKFRDEIRPRFGMMRCREFLMLDSYSFDETPQKAEETYNKHYEAFLNIFIRMGLTAIPMKADSGEIGGDLSHEFVIIANSGESEVIYEKSLENLIDDIKNGKTFENLRGEISKHYAATMEKHEQSADKPHKEYITKRGIEVGHIFYFAQKYSKAMDMEFKMSNGTMQNPYMGSYGIGVGRLIAAFIEANHDEKGIIWHKSISPFDLMLVNLNPKDSTVNAESNNLFAELSEKYEVLYDEEDIQIGEKFSRAELLGIPVSVICSKKTLERNSVEVRYRSTDQTTLMQLDELMKNGVKL